METPSKEEVIAYWSSAFALLLVSAVLLMALFFGGKALYSIHDRYEQRQDAHNAVTIERIHATR